MSHEERLRDRLDERYIAILRAIDQRGGTASSEIKSLTGIETKQVITQRMDRLRDWVLVTTSYRRDPEKEHQLPTKTATLTQYGQQVVDSGILDEFVFEDRVKDVSELNRRVSTLDRRLARVVDLLAALERYFREQDDDEYRPDS